MSRYYFRSGNVVAWNGGIYIVKEEAVVENRHASIVLIPWDSSNCSTHPSTTWPSSKKGIRAIRYLADNVKEFMSQSLEKAMKNIG